MTHRYASERMICAEAILPRVQALPEQALCRGIVAARLYCACKLATNLISGRMVGSKRLQSAHVRFVEQRFSAPSLSVLKKEGAKLSEALGGIGVPLAQSLPANVQRLGHRLLGSSTVPKVLKQTAQARKALCNERVIIAILRAAVGHGPEEERLGSTPSPCAVEAFALLARTHPINRKIALLRYPTNAEGEEDGQKEGRGCSPKQGMSVPCVLR